MLTQFEKRRRAVAVQDAVLRVGLQGVGVQVDGRLEVAALTCLVALLHLLHELRLAETAPAPSIPRHAADRSARCPRAEDRKLEERKAGVRRELQSVQLKNVEVQLKWEAGAYESTNILKCHDMFCDVVLIMFKDNEA